MAFPSSLSSSRVHLARRHRRVPALSLAIALLLALSAALQPASPALAADAATYRSLGTLPGCAKAAFAFVVASDSHAGYGPANESTARAFQDMKSRYSGLSFMVHMGDVTETGSASEYALFTGMAASLPFPVMATPGNHEARWQDPQGSVFREEFGAPNYSFDYGAWHFVVLDTTCPGETLGSLDPATVTWLEKDLASSRDRPVAVFSHHPLLYAPASFQDSDDAFSRILDKYPVAAVFCGHGHSFISWQAQGRQFQMVGALMDGAYALVQVQGTSMTINSVAPGADGKMKESVTATVSGSPRPDLNPASSNPVTSLRLSLADSTVTGVFSLARSAQVSFQVNDGAYNLLGDYGPGEHQFTLDVSRQANGTHSVRLRAVAAGIPYYAPAEFDKGTAGLVAWRMDLGSAVTGDILRYGQNRAILGTRDGTVRCVGLVSGEVIWEYQAGSAWGGGVIDGGTLYFGTASGSLVAMRATNGSRVWLSSVDESGFFAAPVIATTPQGKLIVAGSTSGRVYALKTQTGRKAWQYQAKGAIASAVAVSGGRVFFGAWDGSAYAVYAASGKLAWSTPLGRQVYYAPYLTPAVAGGRVVFTLPYDTKAPGSLMCALDAGTGQVIWKTAAGSSLMTPSVTSTGEVSALDASGNILTFSLSDGSLLKTVPGASTLFTAAPGAGPVYVTGGYRGVLSFITPDGRADFFVRDSSLFTSPLVAKADNGRGWPVYGAAAANARYLTLVADTRGRLAALAFPK